MSTRILFADDSMTAQNMGKRILTDAGYDVIAVSNGAAAVKKIAEQKPDIIILDVYMPGYNGLEVCEKVRASIDTLKTPVLLTVGKMEPYRPEDANRVRADGVIIKPFEATDLLAIVKKLEERIVPRTIALAEQTVLLERPPEFTQPPVREDFEIHSHAPEPAQGIVDVPDHMATAAAFSDLLGMDSSHALDPIPHPKPILEPEITPPEPEPELKAEPPSEEPITAAPTPEFVSMPVEPPPHPPVEEAIKIAPPGYAIDDTQPIPVEREPEAEAHPPELEIVAVEEEEESAEPVKPAFHIEAAKPVEPEPEPVKSVSPEPPSPSVPLKPVFFAPRPEIRPEFSDFTAKTATASGLPVAEAPKIELEPVKGPSNNGLELREPERPAASSEDEFEARVAAAMSIYDEPVEEKTYPEPAITAEKKTDSEIEISSEPAPFTFVPETPFSFEYVPPIATPEFHPMAEAKAEVEPERYEIAPKPLPETEPVARVAESETRRGGPPSAVSSVFEKPDVLAESSFVHTEVSYPSIEISEHHAVAARPAPEPETEPVARAAPPPSAVSSVFEKPDLLVESSFVHEEVSSPAVEKVVELPAAALRPAPEPEAEFRKPEVTESRPPVREEVSSAAIEKIAAEKIAAGIEAELPAAAAAAAEEIGSNTQLISSVVHRVMERLKPELIEEISRELKSKK